MCLNMPTFSKTYLATDQSFVKHASPQKECPFRDWAEEAAISITSFDGHNYEARKERNRKYFTSSGFNSFYQKLEERNVHQVVKDQQLTATTTIIAPPQVIRVEQTKTAIHYSLNIKLATTYTNSKKTLTDTYSVTFKVIELASSPGRRHIDQWTVNNPSTKK
jgi:hypothetical protein